MSERECHCDVCGDDIVFEHDGQYARCDTCAERQKRTDEQLAESYRIRANLAERNIDYRQKLRDCEQALDAEHKVHASTALALDAAAAKVAVWGRLEAWLAADDLRGVVVDQYLSGGVVELHDRGTTERTARLFRR